MVPNKVKLLVKFVRKWNLTPLPPYNQAWKGKKLVDRKLWYTYEKMRICNNYCFCSCKEICLFIQDKGSLGTYAKFSEKKYISYPLIRIRTCAYQGVRNVSFSKNFG